MKTACEGAPFSLFLLKINSFTGMFEIWAMGEFRYILWEMWGKPYSSGRVLLGKSEAVEEAMVFNISFDQKKLID